MHSTARRLARELEDRVVLFILISVLQIPKSHASLRYKPLSVFEWHYLLLIKTAPQSKMQLLKPHRLQFRHLDQIFALRQSYKWQGVGENSLRFLSMEKQQQLLLELWRQRLGCSNCTRNKITLKLATMGRVICPSTNPRLQGKHLKYLLHLSQSLQSAFS